MSILHLQINNMIIGNLNSLNPKVFCRQERISLSLFIKCKTVNKVTLS